MGFSKLTIGNKLLISKMVAIILKWRVGSGRLVTAHLMSEINENWFLKDFFIYEALEKRRSLRQACKGWYMLSSLYIVARNKILIVLSQRHMWAPSDRKKKNTPTLRYHFVKMCSLKLPNCCAKSSCRVKLTMEAHVDKNDFHRYITIRNQIV